MGKRKMITIPYSDYQMLKRTVRDLSLKVADIYRRDSEFLTSTEVCSLLQISHTEYCRYRQMGVIKTYKIAGKSVVNIDELQAALAARRF